MQRIHARLAVVTLAAAAVVAVGTAVSAQSDFGQKMPLRFTALAVDITIKRWTTTSEQERFLSLFREKGAKALLSALQDAPVVGGISTPGSISYDLHYAAIQPLPDGGYSITIATDRPIGFWEATSQERTLDYPFMLIQMQVDKDGNGQGKLARAAKLTISNDVLVIENWANQPMMLNEVRLRK
jgi:hypothetical protein